MKLPNDQENKAINKVKSNGVQSADFDQPENPDILAKAIELRENGKYDEAICYLKDSTTDFCADPNVASIIAHCYILNDDLGKAKIYMDIAKEKNPTTLLVGLNEARFLLKQNKAHEALIVAQQIYETFTNDVEAMVALGACLRVIGELDEGLKFLNKAIECNPDHAEALINRALIKLTKGDKLSAISGFEKAFYQKPHIKQIWYILLKLKMEFNEFEGCISIGRDMLVIESTNEAVIAAVALCNQHLQKHDQAEIFYKNVLDINPNHFEAWANLGTTLKAQGKLKDAVKAYEEAILIKSDYPEALNNMGVALHDQGKFEEAKEAYTKSISLKPDYANAYYNMANSLKAQSRFEEAKEAYKKSISLNPEHANSYYNMGIVLDEQGELEEAVCSFQKAFALRTNIVSESDDVLAPATTALLFELTNKCNFHCVFCPSDSQKRELGAMNLDLIKRLYTEASEKKLASVVNLHLMGEPTLHPNLIEILNYGASKNIKTDLVTNGSTLVTKVVPKILDSLYGTLTASHMTPTEETYHFRGEVGLSWERYINNLRYLVREYLQRKANGKIRKNDITIRVMSTMNTAANCTITENTDEARAILKEWSDFVALLEKELGLDPFERVDYNDPDLLKDNRSATVTYPLQEGIQLKFWRAFTFANTRVSDEYELEDKIEATYCSKPFRDVGVLWNGDVTLCGLDHDGVLSVGNINDSSIEELIQNDAAKKLRASMLGRHPLPSVCQTCQAKPVKI